MFARDIYRDERRGFIQVIQQGSNLRAATGAVLDQLTATANHFCHLDGMIRHQRVLGARNVVLIQLTYLIEQAGPALVVKQLARKSLLSSGQALYYFLYVFRGFGKLAIRRSY
jgi:hypothetical protein